MRPWRKLLQPPAAERVDADPFELERHLRAPASRARGRARARGRVSTSGSASQPSWKSIRQTSSGLAVQQHRAAGDGTAGRTRSGDRPGSPRASRRRRSGSGRGTPGPRNRAPAPRAPCCAHRRRRAASRRAACSWPLRRLDRQRHAVGARSRSPRTWCFQRSSTRPVATAGLHQPFFHIVLLQVDEGREMRARPPAAGRTVHGAVAGTAPRPVFQVTPLSSIRCPMPSRSKISSERLAMQIAREPVLTVSSSSSTTTGWPRRARSSAAVSPTMPAAHHHHRMPRAVRSGRRRRDSDG